MTEKEKLDKQAEEIIKRAYMGHYEPAPPVLLFYAVMFGIPIALIFIFS